ncbi:hypothetical protein RBSWK_01186 [Rhodopirellula baltica SWK14]|uniref:Uncharacterized protein n=1 Tax=Rhodopirellula baltica SWK14 TaxID=993516 RepID=L7CLP4_RHOBT|nr:hypothetical protein RBSWK_01186 [Rhodopirellula baltica SWK14]
MSLRQSHFLQQPPLSLVRRVPWALQRLQLAHEFFQRGKIEPM